jgi:hypothetical protein
MDFSQPALISQCENNCSLTHEQLDDVVPIEMDPQNGMLSISFLLLIFVTYLLVNVFIHSWVLFFTLCFICFDIDINENETVADEQLADSVDNCRPKLKLIHEDTNVKEPKDGMTPWRNFMNIIEITQSKRVLV